MRLLETVIDNIQAPLRADILGMLKGASDVGEVARWWLAPGRALEFVSEVTEEKQPSGRLILIFHEDGAIVGESVVEMEVIKKTYSDLPDPSSAYLTRTKNGQYQGKICDQSFYDRLNSTWSKGPSENYGTLEYPFNNALKLAIAHGSVLGGEARLEWKSQEEAEEEICELGDCDPEAVKRTIHLSYSYFHPVEQRGWGGYLVTNFS